MCAYTAMSLETAMAQIGMEVAGVIRPTAIVTVLTATKVATVARVQEIEIDMEIVQEVASAGTVTITVEVSTEQAKGLASAPAANNAVAMDSGIDIAIEVTSEILTGDSIRQVVVSRFRKSQQIGEHDHQ